VLQTTVDAQRETCDVELSGQRLRRAVTNKQTNRPSSDFGKEVPEKITVVSADTRISLENSE